MIAHLGRAVARAHVRYSELIFTCSAPRSLFRTVTTQHWRQGGEHLVGQAANRPQRMVRADALLRREIAEQTIAAPPGKKRSALSSRGEC